GLLSPFLARKSEFAKVFDHTLLKPDATTAAIEKLVGEALAQNFAAVCVNPCYVPLVARRLLGSSVKTCAVVGFPLGANKTSIKVDEARSCVADGANEIDMVINVGRYLSGDRDMVIEDIQAVHRACGKAGLKVILETCFLE